MFNRHKSDFPSEAAFYEVIRADLLRYTFWISVLEAITLVAAILFNQLGAIWLIAILVNAIAAYLTAPYRNRVEIHYGFDDLQQELALHGVQVRKHGEGPAQGLRAQPPIGPTRPSPSDQPYRFQDLKAELERHGASIRKVDDE